MTEQNTPPEAEARPAGHYYVLLGLLLAIFAVYPFVEEHRSIRWVLNGVFLAMMASALMSGMRRGVAWFILAVFAVSSQALAAAGEAGGMATGVLLSSGLRFAFLALVTGTISADVLRSQRVTMNTVCGASCVYMLMSLAWAAVYSVIEQLVPGSFTLTPPVDGGQAAIDGELTYFSLITMTTVGYGDITPTTPQAQILSALEGLIGQLFLAIIVARFVALEIASRFGRNS